MRPNRVSLLAIALLAPAAAAQISGTPSLGTPDAAPTLAAQLGQPAVKFPGYDANAPLPENDEWQLREGGAFCVEANMCSSGGFVYNATNFSVAQAFTLVTAATADGPSQAMLTGLSLTGVYLSLNGVENGLEIPDNFEINYFLMDIKGYGPNARQPIATFRQDNGSLTVTETLDEDFFSEVASGYTFEHAPVLVDGSTNVIFSVKNTLDPESGVLWHVVPGDCTNFDHPLYQSTTCPDLFVRQDDVGSVAGFCLSFSSTQALPPPMMRSIPQPSEGDGLDRKPYPDTFVLGGGALEIPQCFRLGVGIDGRVDLNDFSCYLSMWADNIDLADITSRGSCDLAVRDCIVDINDFSCYLALWAVRAR